MVLKDYREKKNPTVDCLLKYAHHLYHGFPLRLITTDHNLQQTISNHETNRPSLNLVGFFDHFAYQRVQIFGQGEISYLNQLIQDNQLSNIKKFFEYDIPCVIFAHEHTPHPTIIEMAHKKKIPILVSSLSTNQLTERLYDFFSEYLFISEVVHGLMMQIGGIGVLVKSEENFPLSEIGLELIRRGHYFVADDVVNLKKQKEKFLIAFTSDMIAHHMDIPGTGIINIAHLFGVKSILNDRRLDLIINLKYFDEEKNKGDLAPSSKFETILDINIPKESIFVKPSIDIATLIEVATMNHRLKSTGYDPTEEFNKRILKYSHPSKLSPTIDPLNPDDAPSPP